MESKKIKWAAAAVILLIAVGVMYLVWNGVFIITVQEVRLPILAIAGIIALFATLALVSLSFAVADLSDRTQALGLPEGSIRAAVALGLLVLFSIISIYLHGSLSAGEVKVLSGLADAQKQEFIKNAQILQRIQIVSETTEAVASDKKDSEKRYSVYFRELPSQAGQDFAKQLMILIGTLLTAVASFYFGSRAAASASSASTESPAPVLRAVNPKSLTKGAGAALEFQIEGDGLDLIKEVKIVQGSAQIVATGVTSNASVVKCKVDLPASAPAGAWDVVATDGSGKKTMLSGALTVI